MATSAKIRPGLDVITTTRSDTATASDRSCVTKSTDCWCCWHRRNNRSSSCSLVWASSAPNGSSIKSSGDPNAKVRASATRWRIPCDKALGNIFSNPAKPTSCNILRARSWACARGTPRTCMPNMAFSIAVFQGNRLSRASMYPTCGLPCKGLAPAN